MLFGREVAKSLLFLFRQVPAPAKQRLVATPQVVTLLRVGAVQAVVMTKDRVALLRAEGPQTLLDRLSTLGAQRLQRLEQAPESGLLLGGEFLPAFEVALALLGSLLAARDRFLNRWQKRGAEGKQKGEEEDSLDHSETPSRSTGSSSTISRSA